MRPFLRTKINKRYGLPSYLQHWAIALGDVEHKQYYEPYQEHDEPHHKVYEPHDEVHHKPDSKVYHEPHHEVYHEPYYEPYHHGYHHDCCPAVVDPYTYIALISAIALVTYFMRVAIVVKHGRKRRGTDYGGGYMGGGENLLRQAMMIGRTLKF